MAAKWLGKKTQFLSEAVNKNVEKTEYDPDFVELEQKTDATRGVVERLVRNVPLFLHPNPAARAKCAMSAGISKMNKKANDKRYPHAIGDIAEVMNKGGQELGDDSVFGQSLTECAETFNRIVDAQHAFDSEVQQNFLDPLKVLMDKDLREIAKHRKKLEGRRLDFDYKRRKMQSGKSNITEAEVKIAEQKMEESKGLSESAMSNLMDGEAEQVSQLAAFVQAYQSLAQNIAEELGQLNDTLQSRMGDATNKPRRERKQPEVHHYDDDDDDDFGDVPEGDQPCAKAAFDFEAENDTELSFKEGDFIILTARLDENWLEGECNGRSGMFPANYVDVIREP